MPSKDKIVKLNETYEDALFRLVMSDAAEEEGRRYLEENEILNTNQVNSPSAENIKRFTKLLDSKLKKRKKSARYTIYPFSIKLPLQYWQ